MSMGQKYSNSIIIKLFNGILMTNNVLHVMSYPEYYQPAHNVLQSLERGLAVCKTYSTHVDLS